MVSYITIILCFFTPYTSDRSSVYVIFSKRSNMYVHVRRKSADSKTGNRLIRFCQNLSSKYVNFVASDEQITF